MLLHDWRLRRGFKHGLALLGASVWLLLIVWRAQANISLQSFTATAEAGQVRVAWSTATELDTLGFYLQRSLEQNGTYLEITEFIFSEGDGLTGADYEAIDSDVSDGATYFYRLLVIDSDQSEHYFGPISVAYGAASTATSTATLTATSTPTPTVTPTATSTTEGETQTPTATTETPLQSETSTATQTSGAQNTLTSTATQPSGEQNTLTPTATATSTDLSSTLTSTPTATPTTTSTTFNNTPTITRTPTRTTTSRASSTSTKFPIITFTHAPTLTPTPTETSTTTSTPTITPTPTTTLLPLPSITLLYPSPIPTDSPQPQITTTPTFHVWNPLKPTLTSTRVTPMATVGAKGGSLPLRVTFIIAVIVLTWLLLGAFLVVYLRRMGR